MRSTILRIFLVFHILLLSAPVSVSSAPVLGAPFMRSIAEGCFKVFKKVGEKYALKNVLKSSKKVKCSITESDHPLNACDNSWDANWDDHALTYFDDVDISRYCSQHLSDFASAARHSMPAVAVSHPILDKFRAKYNVESEAEKIARLEEEESERKRKELMARMYAFNGGAFRYPVTKWTYPLVGMSGTRKSTASTQKDADE